MAQPAEPMPWPQRWKALLGVWPIVTIFVLVFGGIYAGIFTPTEGAAVGAIGTFIAGLAKRELSLQGIKSAFLGTAETSAMVFMIFLGADMMNSSLALTQMPANLADWVAHLQVPPLVIVACVLVFYVILGCVMDELSMILLDHPRALSGHHEPGPVGPEPAGEGHLVRHPGADDGGIGLIAPPVGLNVYVVNSICRDVPMSETYKGVLPFLVSDFFRVLLLLFVPVVSLGAVRWLFQ